jgi:hypothetical protein
MLSALSGGDSLQIIVEMKNLTSAGFKQIQSDIAKTETAAGSVNLSGVSTATKNVEKDATAAEGKSGGGGIMGLVSGLTGLGPQGMAVGAAIAGMAVLTGAAIELGKTYDSIEAQDKVLDAALKAHGDSLANEKTNLDSLIASNEKYGQNADATRGAVTTLAQAGQSWADIQKSMPAILDLAAAKHLSLADAAKAVELAEMGNSRSLKQLGIVLPTLTAPTAAVTKAQNGVTTATKDLASAQAALTLKQTELAGKHKLTAAQSLELKAAEDKVTQASLNLHGAQNKLDTAQQAAAKSGDRQTLVLTALEKRIGGTRNSATEMQKAQAKLSDEWQKAATTFGPGIEQVMSAITTDFALLIDKAIDLTNWLASVFGWFASLAPVQAFGTVIGALVGHFGDLWNMIQTVIQKLADLIKGVEDAGQAIANSPIGQLAGGLGNLGGSIGGALGGIHLTGGGYVPPVPGGTLATLAEAGVGEYVIPANQMSGGGGTTFNIVIGSTFPPTAAQARDLANALEAELGRRFALHGSSASFGGF